MSYIPQELKHLNEKFELYQITFSNVSGVVKATAETKIGEFFANFKTYGGTERDVNGVLMIEDTAVITTHYRPDIRSDSYIVRVRDKAKFEIINEPENIELRNIALKFKVRRIKGKING